MDEWLDVWFAAKMKGGNKMVGNRIWMGGMKNILLMGHQEGKREKERY